MKIKKENLPVRMQTPDTIMRNFPGYGGMTVAFNEMPAGTGVTPLLEELKNNSCHCPHWGYIVQGAIRVIYDDALPVMFFITPRRDQQQPTCRQAGRDPASGLNVWSFFIKSIY